ncbi:VOC family protein [Staphylococcus caeli]|uniref:Glyoxalase n=1 Tax=Staphylococcus caeli TaxID=2201815 RepID=A0A1D4HV54_9STAP|nr:VOC family protein [Staphylococcus caeli]SCS41065.1 glyoxalase [Staphylococcus caeli]SCS59536.1 glyoxalase [Staphylococcus caeli]
MNIQSAWLNLPVKDLKASATFFENIGFAIKQNEAVLDKMRGIETVDHKIIMLIQNEQFEKVAQLTDIGKNEALVSVSVSETAEVDTLLDLVEKAGGKVIQRGTKHEGYYGGLFSDIDGHLFNVIAM